MAFRLEFGLIALASRQYEEARGLLTQVLEWAVEGGARGDAFFKAGLASLLSTTSEGLGRGSDAARYAAEAEQYAREAFYARGGRSFSLPRMEAMEMASSP